MNPMNFFYIVRKKSTGERKLVCGAQWMAQELMLCDEQTAMPPTEVVKFDDVEFVEAIKNVCRAERE